MSIQPLLQDLQALAVDYQAQGYFPSLSLAVFNSQDMLFRFTLGEAREDSLFDIASLSKIFTATIVLRLIDEGRFDLDTPLLALNETARQDSVLCEGLRGITIYQLLTHTSTLPAWYPIYTQPDFYAALREAILLERVDGMMYSDLNFMLLGQIVQDVYPTVAGESLLARALCKPLFIKGAHDVMDESLRARAIPSGYGNPEEEAVCAKMGLHFDRFRSHTPISGEVHDGNAHHAFYQQYAGHAGIFSDVESLVTLCRYYLTTDSELLKSAQREQTQGRGLGFAVGEMYPKGCGHTGFTGTSLYLSRELDIGCVILSNRCFYKDLNYKPTKPFRKEAHQLVADYAQAFTNLDA
ncbi:MAG: beta-lactamase family protein [Clostridiales bacterium]|nr:beta-lactamase family protein [Clostridiales bacterium]